MSSKKRNKPERKRKAPAHTACRGFFVSRLTRCSRGDRRIQFVVRRAWLYVRAMGATLAHVLKRATLVTASVAVFAILAATFGSPQVNAAPADAGQVADAPTLSL